MYCTLASKMGSMWKKVKVAVRFILNLNLKLSSSSSSCVDGRRRLNNNQHEDEDDYLFDPYYYHHLNSDLYSSSLESFSLSSTSSKSSKRICSICLTEMREGRGHDIFTAECSHSFHLHCIVSNVKHGNQICPLCRAKWKQVPSLAWPQRDALMAVARPLPPPPHQRDEPGMFDDDEPLNHRHAISNDRSTTHAVKGIEIKTYPQVSAIPMSNTYTYFTILVHIKAKERFLSRNNHEAHLTQVSETHRAPIDLVTVLDISNSMAGTKLSLLKKAMRFVIQNLGPNDRLSVIAFSSSARRLFPLLRMSDSGRQMAQRAVNSLVPDGGTYIAAGLRKGAKVMEDRKEKNPVASIMLLSDGQDTYIGNTYGANQLFPPNYKLLRDDKTGLQIPVHTFGFGADHDALSMHKIAEICGGTFSFIETGAAIQDAFAQCIGGLLSVVVQRVKVEIECTNPSLSLVSLKAGSHQSMVFGDGQIGFVHVGDMYADEERDFLVSVNVPATSRSETSLIRVKCAYKDPMTQEERRLESEEVKIERPRVAGGEVVVSVEVDRQRNRFRAAEAMAEARAVAEERDLGGAVLILEECRKELSESVSYKCMDRLCVALDAELKEMQERMGSRQAYEASGRAYMLSGMSSHSCQRATARGDSTHSSSLVEAYQTQSMAEMLTRSQTLPSFNL